MKNTLLLSFVVLMTFTFLNIADANAQSKEPIVRLAKIDVDPAQLDNYKAFLKEEIETSIRIEPGVITLYAVSEKINPTHITIFETYADNDAYLAHLQRPHFLKYKAAVKDMVKKLELVEVTTIALDGKPKS
ncbi:putative quinol monooxygenase [Mucilaginibacter sp. KACC 22773]|uniref:putative quinol monooxygenase n=1 Tax=Mucilaginibacter sp. KACC 22773 TaxID=3025671 RepID=UPI0023657E3D|nr:putative quinol monooxygenase [Mucilaginibacter sp. KACC 22773]WDF77201.1 putative quinol monooxygenase [Mucilaginibacter sp. KACC 22773]